MIEKVAKLGIKEPIARPSRPSVKLTALLLPIIKNNAHGKNKTPKSGLIFLKNGIVIFVFKSPDRYQNKIVIDPNKSCKKNLYFSEMPFL